MPFEDLNLNNLDFKKMTKGALVDLLEKLRSERAFSYEDRMKLKILDESPFTIWASDRNCIIKFWDGKCEKHYGYSREEALGQDFVDLFVDKDESDAARDDQLKIIDNGEVFHNIANDHGKDGNILHLITNCRRIQDIRTGEMWNAEMGLIIDYLEDEKERLDQVISESRKVRECVTQFLDSTKQDKDQLAKRAQAFNTAVKKYESCAIKKGKRDEFKSSVAMAKQRIEKISDELDDTIEKYCDLIKACRTFEACKETRLKYIKKSMDILDQFEETVLDVEEIAHKIDCSNSILSRRDSVLTKAYKKSREYGNEIAQMLSWAEKEVDDYRSLVNPSGNTDTLQVLMSKKENIEKLKSEVDSYFENVSLFLPTATTEKKVNELEQEMDTKIEEYGDKIIALKEELER